MGLCSARDRHLWFGEPYFAIISVISYNLPPTKALLCVYISLVLPTIFLPAWTISNFCTRIQVANLSHTDTKHSGKRLLSCNKKSNIECWSLFWFFPLLLERDATFVSIALSHSEPLRSPMSLWRLVNLQLVVKRREKLRWRKGSLHKNCDDSTSATLLQVPPYVVALKSNNSPNGTIGLAKLSPCSSTPSANATG